MHPLERAIDGTSFSGVVRIDRGGDVELARAYGLAHRGHEIPNTVDTLFATASGTKGLTAVTVASLVEEGALELSTTARSVLGPDLPLIRDDVTIEHLLSHRSGIGDYLDENVEHDIADYLMPVPVHELATTEQYLAVLDGHDTAFPPGERFAYNNGGYVVLALIAERTSGIPFHELVRQRVCEPAGMVGHRVPALRRAAWPRCARVSRWSTACRGRTCSTCRCVAAATEGSTPRSRTSAAFWSAFFAGEHRPRGSVAELVRPRSDVPEESRRYGLGFWLDESSDVVMLVGSDAGVSFWSAHDPRREQSPRP